MATLAIQRGEASLGQLRTVVDEVVTALADPASPEAQTAAQIDPALRSVDPDAVDVRDGPGRFFGAEFLFQVGVGVTSAALLKLWETVVWPRLRDRFGDKAAGRVEAAEDDD